ncbi:hypothetical protein N7478_000403 [Penicillium angulare]|uniref:uncharacterized protein n=1 Tax=Penicillium angulare TaxID=116970 RepID=UPI00253F9244|nr:uncharacterized protein N7478_000403 [Penicillium angulare]KAJ5291152.1 hypothetical protein N7478_000403 [Penicillium angulare]
MDSETDIAPESLFRPAKRRKFVPRRPQSTDDPTATEPATTSHEVDTQVADVPSPGDQDQSAQTANVARLRRPHQSRRGGIGFSATSQHGNNSNRQTALVSTEDIEAERIQAMGDRFTTYTGQSEDVDKHMMAYIDSEMAKRYNRSPVLDNIEAHNKEELRRIGESTKSEAQREPASLGKLHEIDLGQETKMQNIARTQAATRRLVGDEDSPTTGDIEPQPDRSGSDKVWRKQKRRNSADVERDRLVEEVLRESKLDVYDEPEEEMLAGDQAADDRIAEQFRRDFMDAIQSRRRLRATRTTKTDKTEAPKGPKLGGSRSARAAMREMQTKTGQK